jgi:GntR family transcriptional regulator
MSQRNRIVPKYFQVEQLLRGRVSSLSPGALLPAEPILAKEYGVSRATLRVAVDALAADGLVTRIQGRGTFVSQTRLDIPIGYQASKESIAQSEHEVKHRLTNYERCTAAPEMAELFQVDPKDRILRVERVTYRHEVPLGVGMLVLPAELAKGVTRRDFEHGRFFNTLVTHGINIVRYRLVIESSIIPAMLAETLGVRPGLPAISLTRTGYGKNGRALAQVEILTRGDIGRYVLDSDFNATRLTMGLSLAGGRK